MNASPKIEVTWVRVVSFLTTEVDLWTQEAPEAVVSPVHPDAIVLAPDHVVRAELRDTGVVLHGKRDDGELVHRLVERLVAQRPVWQHHLSQGLVDYLHVQRPRFLPALPATPAETLHILGGYDLSILFAKYTPYLTNLTAGDTLDVAYQLAKVRTARPALSHHRRW